MTSTATTNRRPTFRAGSFASITSISSLFSPSSEKDRLILPIASPDTSSPPDTLDRSERRISPLLRALNPTSLALKTRTLISKVKRSARARPLVVFFFVCLSALLCVGALSRSGFEPPQLFSRPRSLDLRSGQAALSSPVQVDHAGPSQRELEELWKKMKRGKGDVSLTFRSAIPVSLSPPPWETPISLPRPITPRVDSSLVTCVRLGT
ncbi:hypothetical protein BDY24DRAFT_379936 [Mrakia frigida]|uniref:uncharacterized protein n=1 Tax=Mrakia frigida TaxID=29902 RepID=UPI003FCC2566